MRLLILAVLLVSTVAAGSREDPELPDAVGDVTRSPDLPSADPNVDLIAAWFEEDAEHLYIYVETAARILVPDLPDVLTNPIFAVNVFVNGEGESTPCSGWGRFGVQAYVSTAQTDGWLRVYAPYEEGDEGCGGLDLPVEVAVEDQILRWSVPKQVVPDLMRAGDVLTVARGSAWSGSTWPATPQDRFDQAPGRAFTVMEGMNGTVESEPAKNQTSPAPTNQTQAPPPPATETVTSANQTEEPIRHGPAKGTPLAPWLPVAGLMMAGGLARRHGLRRTPR